MSLDELRKVVDQINEEIVALFARRLEITKQIAKVKKEQKLPVDDFSREEKQYKMLRELSQKHGLSPAVIEEIFNLLVDYSKLTMKMEMGHVEKDRLPGN
jgi:chorismate mutase